MFELSVFFREKLVGRSTFSEDEVRIGRSADNEVQIDNLGLSRYHASVERVGDLHLVKDFGSQNGTFVNGERVNGRRALNDGDKIGIGKFVLVFKSDEKAAAPEAKVRDEASYKVAGATMVAASTEARERTCPFVGYLAQASSVDRPTYHPIGKDAWVVGSEKGADLVVPGAAPRAAIIVRTWRGFLLLALAPGVTRNGDPVELRAELHNGDDLQVGPAAFVFRAGRPDGGA